MNQCADAKQIVVLMDGTWNEPEFVNEDGTFPQRDATNIERLKHLLVADDNQSVLYFRGIGTDGKKVSRVLDGAYGRGAKDKVDEAYDSIASIFDAGDAVSIIGFSRGASTARMLARRISQEGINQQSTVHIPFLGLFDTVAAFGIPDTSWNWESGWDGFKKTFASREAELQIPNNVGKVVHLLAIDEDRVPFLPTLLTFDDENHVDALEVWFAGNHGDVGGGWPATSEGSEEHRLWHITLRYMISKALDSALRFVSDWESAVPPNPSAIGTVHELAQSLEDAKTLIGGKTVRPLVSQSNGAKARVHKSVQKRFDQDVTYRPPNLRTGFSSVLVVD